MLVHIKSITQLADSYGAEKPKHPQVVVVDLSKVGVSESMTNVKVIADLYSVVLKTKSPMGVKYGRSYLDFAEGSLYGSAPGQVVEVSDVAAVGDLAGWALYFHPDLIRGHALGSKISSYGFFDYATNEALHLAEQEKQTLSSIVEKIDEECATNIDEYSRDVLVSNIELLLNYVKRYYGRQFITRTTQNTGLLSRFERELNHYFESEQSAQHGLPTVHQLAATLHLSPSYLSDLLKKETGKNAQEHIHFQLIEQAKSLLLNSEETVAEIAFKLGFEHPPYFSRLFKNKTGMSPSKFRFSVN